MKAAILAMTLVAGDAQAEVVNCPALHKGARLVGAGMYEGDQKEAELIGAARKVRGGFDADFGFSRGDVRWLACVYEPEVVHWYRLSPALTRCELKTRGATPGKVTATVRCK
jgi:hypothetical protein